MQLDMSQIMMMLELKMNRMESLINETGTKLSSLMRILWKKQLFTRDEIFQELKEECTFSDKIQMQAYKKEGEKEPENLYDDEYFNLMTDMLISYLECDVEKLKEQSILYAKKIKELAKKESELYENKIQVADASTLDKLDAVSKNSKLIL